MSKDGDWIVRLIHAHERRLDRYLRAAARWTAVWPAVSKEIEGLALSDAHRMVVRRAAAVLPFGPAEEAL